MRWRLPGLWSRGAFIGDFDPDTYKSDRKDQGIAELVVVAGGAKEAAVSAGVSEGTILGEAQNFARGLVNEPGNVMTPTFLGQKAAEMCAQYGLKCEVYGAEKLKELKMGAFWAVAKGSAEPPALIVMTYEPAKAPASPVLGLVGKGITFDTGGISIKGADGMEKMKYDMAGGGHHDWRDAGNCPVEAGGEGDRDCVRGGEYAFRNSDEAGGCVDCHVWQEH